MSEPEAYRAALRAAVAGALRPYAATVTEATDAASGMWGIDVTPAAPGAAALSVAYDAGDECTLAFGTTHAYLWDADPAALGATVAALVESVVAGRFEEAGSRADATARLRLADGSVARVGAVRPPVPWRLRRRRTYRPYGRAGT